MMAASSGKLHGIYLCHKCDESFATKKACMDHTKSHYPEAQQTFSRPSTSQNASTSSESNIPTSTTANKDTKTDEPEPTDVVPSLKNFSDEEILAVLLERNYAFVCKCGIIFRDQALYYLHRGTHSARNPYECSFCGHVAPDWFDFTSHFYVHSKD